MRYKTDVIRRLGRMESIMYLCWRCFTINSSEGEVEVFIFWVMWSERGPQMKVDDMKFRMFVDKSIRPTI